MLRRLLVTACLICATAHADPPPPPPPPVATYAIVVGSNSGGPGQTDLRYAEDDAKRVGALLVELGGYTPDRVQIVLHPNPDQLRDALAQLAERVRADAASGRQSRVFFYYSGHARSTAIDLGADELPLAELRSKLFDVPSTLTVVVLDACQSGAFSRVKGAQPAADFSINSRQHLDASGVAVLASSSGSELSQESEQLRSSYFTHHLLVGLRGAGDANGDGEVSIDEAYRYAYHQTLLATAETAVGGQHVTFEADLKGHGEVPLSYPRAATAAIELPAAVEGQAIVEDKRAHAVVAETYKAKGAPVRIAVAPGDYEVIVRHGTTLSRCELTTPSTLDLSRCRSEAIVATTTKGGGFRFPTRIEVGGFLGNDRSDAYTQNLNAFGYQTDAFYGAVSAGLSVAGLRRYHEWLWAGALALGTNLPEYSRSIAGSGYMQRFDWSTYALEAVGRAETPEAEHGVGKYLSAYAQVSAGLGFGRTHLRGPMMTSDDTTYGLALGFAAGVHLNSLWLDPLGVMVGYAFDYQPVITDLIDHTHAAGGHRITAAFTYRF
jgi:hypothetical protein